MSFTLAPAIPPTFFDGSTVAASYKLFTYEAGTTTKTTTYQDSAGMTANTNPIILDSAGRATIFLDASATAPAVKFVLAPSDATDPPTAPIWTRDNVQPIPIAQADLDVTGTAGEDLAAGDCVYLSDGTGSLAAGSWYKTDADQTYSSSLANGLGFVPDAISSGESGQIRRGGRITGLAGLVAGTLYYISATAGEITSSAPSNKRAVAVADSSTSAIILEGEVPSVWTSYPDASASVAGIVSTGTQTLAGAKTFANALTLTAGFASPPLGVPTYSRCTATLTKNANTTLEDVAGLVFAVGASQVWAFRFELFLTSNASADHKFTLTGPSSPTSIWFGGSANQGALSPASAAAAFGTAIQFSSAGIDEGLTVMGLLRNGANAGTVQLQYAQHTSNASNSQVYVNSYVIAWRIS